MPGVANGSRRVRSLGAARDLYQAMSMAFWLPQVQAVLAQAEER